MNTLRYFIYARKSTDAEDKQITSIEDQISETQKIAQRLNLQVVDIISESKSAKEPGREAFNQMLTRIHKGEADGILCWKLNRLARNPIDGGQISWMLQQQVIKHIQTNDSDYKPEDNVLIMLVEFGVANQFVNDLSVDVKRGMRKKAERGWLPAPVLPLGYLHNSKREVKQGKEIINDSSSFKKVKRLWELLLTGEYAIADLKKEGDLMNLRTIKGNYLSLSSYYRMFSNPFYAGRFRWRGASGTSQEYQGKHEPMISEQEFEKARKICGIRYTPPLYCKEEKSYRSLFSCGECGCAMTRDRVKRAYCKSCKRKFSIKNRDRCPSCHRSIKDTSEFTFLDKVYYRCTKKKKKCSQKYIEESKLTNIIESYFEDMILSDDFLQWALEALKNVSKQPVGGDIQKELSKTKNILKRRLKNYTMMRADNEINADEFAMCRRDIEEQLTRTERQLKNLVEGDKETITGFKDAISFLKLTKEGFKNKPYKERRAMIQQLGSNPIISGEKLYFATPKTYYSLRQCHQVYTQEKSRLEPTKSVENLNVFDRLNLPFSFLCTEVELARTIAINNSHYCTTDNKEHPFTSYPFKA